MDLLVRDAGSLILLSGRRQLLHFFNLGHLLLLHNVELVGASLLFLLLFDDDFVALGLIGNPGA